MAVGLLPKSHTSIPSGPENTSQNRNILIKLSSLSLELWELTESNPKPNAQSRDESLLLIWISIEETRLFFAPLSGANSGSLATVFHFRLIFSLIDNLINTKQNHGKSIFW